MNKTGILLSNLGTPSVPTTMALRSYLREFLSDPYVVDKPRWLWLPILYGIILLIRPPRSAEKYRQIWTPEGSPLLTYSEKITQQLQSAMPEYKVDLGMRYGKPSLKAAIEQLQQTGINKLILLPLYPQYSFSTTKSTIAAVKTLVAETNIKLQVIDSYYQHPLYIAALAATIQNFWQIHGRAEQLIFSFHGLPEAMIQKGDPYLKQCQTTVKLLVEKLNLNEHEYQLTFQSRLGVETWLKPYTMDVMRALPKQGIKDIQVVCPGFSCDCLETLEEIDLRYRKIFVNAGGEKFAYIPCLNDSPLQINLLQQLVKDSD
jgi:protoporphyrin/coproporphyrin ferrochelatase